MLTQVMINEKAIIHASLRDISEQKTLTHRLKMTTQNYKNLNMGLDKRVKEQSSQLIKQSRMAHMGELLSMIAHQWRQPLGFLAAIAGRIKLKIELGHSEPDSENTPNSFEEYIYSQMDEVEVYIDSLSTTIDDFRTLYKPNKTMASASCH